MACLWLLAPPLFGQPLDAANLGTALDKLMSSSLVQNASVAVAFYSPADSSLIYGHRAGSKLVPASLQKIYTGVGVLEELGSGYRFQTEIGSQGNITDGILRGDLVVKGGGDPSWMSDIYPEGPHKVFELWADSLLALGVTRIEGDLIGDISLYPTYPYNPLWEDDDLPYGWAPATSALSFNENLVRFDLKGASSPGKKAHATPKYGYNYFKFTNKINTISSQGSAAIWLQVSSDNRAVTLQGKLGVNTPEYLNPAVRNPPLFTLQVMKETLRKKGIYVSGKIRLEEERAIPDSTRTLFTFASLPLRDILGVMLKNSSNMLAESLLCHLGASPDSGAVLIESRLRGHGLPGEELRIRDGSGLARQNLCTASHLGLTLSHAYHQDWFEVFLNSLAKPGEEGTLRKRFKNHGGQSVLFGKTGTMRGISNLVGYLRAADGELYAFVILCNNAASIANAKKWQESVCDLLLRYDGGREW